jgi:hypothetical protein
MSGSTHATRDSAPPTRGTESRRRDNPDVRRFTVAALTGAGVAAIPFLWVLWNGRLDPLRRFPTAFLSNFYDLQARALAHGHWWVPKGSLGNEAFTVHGRDYMYFGPFPALIRMPILAVTHSLDGRLTAPSILLAWLLTGLFTSLLLWRVRILVRGPALLGRAEAASYAVLVVTIMSGSVLLYLAALPAVYYEALMWGVALTVGAFFALLGVLERPSVGRVVATGALTLGAVLSRSAIGWACVVGVLLTAAWFATGRGGPQNRRWWLPVLAAGIGALAVGCAVSWVKFGGLFDVPYGSQFFTRASAHRRAFLAANGGTLFNVKFVPSTLLAYLRPDALRFGWVFPFVTLPSVPARAVAGVVLDQSYRTTSVPASMPLLVLLGVWGVVSAFRRRLVGPARLFRILLVAAATGTLGTLVLGYIGNRFLGDFIPLLVVASAVGLVALWQGLDGRSRRVRRGAVACVAALGCFGVVANLGVATEAGRLAGQGERLRDYVAIQKSVSDLTGHPLQVHRVTRLPGSAPPDELFVVGDCTVLAISTGENQFPQMLTVDRPPDVTVNLTYHGPEGGRIPLVTVGQGPSVVVSVEGRGTGGRPSFRFRVDGVPHRLVSRWMPLTLRHRYEVDVATVTAFQQISVVVDGETVVRGTSLAAASPTVVQSRQQSPGNSGPLVTVASRPVPAPPLCRRLVGHSESSNRASRGRSRAKGRGNGAHPSEQVAVRR